MDDNMPPQRLEAQPIKNEQKLSTSLQEFVRRQH